MYIKIYNHYLIMKIIPLFNYDDSNSSKLLYIEKINYLNFEKINEYKTLRLNCNFSNNYLEKLLKTNKCCSIIFNDLKLFISMKRYFLRTSKLYDGYRIIFTSRNSNNIKYLTNLNSKLEILNSLFEECKFYLDNNFNIIPFTNLINIVNILYNYNEKEIYSSYNRLYLINDKFIIEKYLKDQITNLNIDKILKVLVYLENQDLKNKLFEIILEKIKQIKYDDSLIPELLEMISLNDINDKYFANLIKLIEIDKKSKKLLFDQNFDNVNKKSVDLYSSVITRTNWIEELKYGNIMGLLLKISPKDINKNGYKLDYVPIGEITHTIIGFDQILEAYKINKNDNLYGNILSGYGVGNGNCILPLFINSNHWNLVKLYIDFNLGIIFNRNPLLFHNRHKDVYKNVLIYMINLTFCNNNYNSDRWLNLLFSVLRTNYELFGNDNNSISQFMIDKKYRITCNLNNILIDYLFLKGNDNVIRIIFVELIRRTFRSLYRNINILDSIYLFTIDSALKFEKNYKIHEDFNLINTNEFNNWIYSLESNPIFSEKITIMYAIIKMREMINEKNIFKKFDDNYGILDDESLYFIKNYIINKKITPENGELFGILNDKFTNHINYTKDKVFSIRTFIDINLVENKKQLFNIFIQGILQRVDKCRKKAIENDKVQDPFIKNDIIKNAGLLISQRYIKKFFGLDNNLNYLNTINKLENSLLPLFIETMIKKTISVKKFILDKIESIDKDKREIVRILLDKK